MPYDDIIIGSGLSALAVAKPLASEGRKILVLGGSAEGVFRHYPASGENVPAAYSGIGGLGKYWHGAIPLSFRNLPDGFSEAGFVKLLGIFYPQTSFTEHLGKDLFFVPQRPVRPQEHWKKLVDEYPQCSLISENVKSIKPNNDKHIVITADNEFTARHIWVAAGALDTPRLLARSGLIEEKERKLSDHIIGYAGQTQDSQIVQQMMRTLTHVREGVFFPSRFDPAAKSLYSLRPARFDFAKLDAGIEKRAVFGMPTSRAVVSIAGKFSPGLIAEALYNKFGWFPSANLYSIYFMTEVIDAYDLSAEGELLAADKNIIESALKGAIDNEPFEAVEHSRSLGLYLPGIHLHGAISSDEINTFNNCDRHNNIHLVDASVLEAIGPEHHSFKMMAVAYDKAKSTL